MAKRGPRRVIWASTMELTSGRTVPPPPEPVPRIPGSVEGEGRVMERRGVGLLLVVVVRVAGVGVLVTGPAIEA